MTKQKYALVFVLAFYLFTSVGFQLQPIKAAGFNIGAIKSAVSGLSRDEDEILWLARIVYSETKRAEEQVLVAWVVRNRVESKYKGASYKDVALHDSQFSGLNSFDKNYRYNITKNYNDTEEGWQSAVSVARAVYNADEALRPLSKNVKHFYSPVSVRNTPSWAKGVQPSQVVRDSKNSAIRFAFYEDIK